jgi:sterol desaturase/sphingolipid hydroxylase (fatty acid hydroxylase superfamily)
MFWLAPHQPQSRPQSGSPRMFRIDWVEKYLSRVRPWHVLAVWAPISAYSLYRGFRLTPLLAGIAVAVLGVFTWTLLEYILHRWLFHHHFSQDSEAQRDLGFLIHGVHHDYPMDPDRLVMPPAISVLVAAAIGVPAWFIAGPAYFWAFFGGLVGGYLWYDLTHYATHHGKSLTGIGKLQKSYHMLHHYQTPNIRYGITTPFWDLVFGTYPWRVKAQAETAPRAEAH